MKRWILGIAMAGALLAGCSSSGEEQAADISESETAAPTFTAQPSSTVPPTAAPTATPPPAQVTLVESGFTSYTDSSGNLIGSWAAILQNPNPSKPSVDTEVRALFYGADNVLLKTDTTYAALILPSDVSAVGSNYVSLTAAPARVEIRLSETEFTDALPGSVKFSVTDVAYVPDRFSPAINAKVSNPLAKDVKDLTITCMAVAPDGKYAAIGNSYLELSPAGATAVATCRLDSRMVVPAGSTPRLFVGFSNITSVGP